MTLVVRWLHFVVGVAWIGASFYFNWLENRLQRTDSDEQEVAGDLWAIHGGGFYHLEKYRLAPPELPGQLHWFKWEAYTTWISGVALLVLVYYFNAAGFMLDGPNGPVSPAAAVGIGAGSLLLSWLVYDGLCRSPLKSRPALLTAAVFIYLCLLALLLTGLLSGRAAFIHVGAAIGTIMVANVLMVIIPAQRELVKAVAEGRSPDPAYGANGLLRSRHNNYLTLPVLFIMISGHYPVTYGHGWSWLVLVLVSAAGVAVRHYFNVRHLKSATYWTIPVMLALILAAVWITRPAPPTPGLAQVSFEQVRAIVGNRCASCHAKVPTQPGFVSAPAGVLLDSDAAIRRQAERIHAVAVQTRSMPVGNLTGMTDEERSVLGQWITQPEQKKAETSN